MSGDQGFSLLGAVVVIVIVSFGTLSLFICVWMAALRRRRREEIEDKSPAVLEVDGYEGDNEEDEDVDDDGHPPEDSEDFSLAAFSESSGSGSGW